MFSSHSKEKVIIIPARSTAAMREMTCETENSSDLVLEQSSLN